MAATSTNKQPLLVDHVLHTVINLDLSTNEGIDVSGANTAELLLDSTSADGAIIEDLYLISRGTIKEKVMLFLSSANDYLRPNQARYIGDVESSTTVGAITNMTLPRTLAPVPQVGSEAFNRALYVPKGTALWAARFVTPGDTGATTTGPNIAIQGGWY